ncbi:type 1 glutamine amidotransferase domain-containing protein [Actinoplanes couchii]|uniref:Dimethylallyltransferase n=1 Tax=Actinoplanes couchii TaxID=403638 RepID=A0ABQ3XRW5_9ACTN|nr:type 1 glutamine amidotransferase domain-containing protein [Actinoplanes couchii]MDR6318726.1 putative intracellular protease/amidase [Actinoplanes couchii]GID61254.1 dimethylallyltransferase [Actinoplanes couchii]
MTKKILFVISAADHWTLKDGTRRPSGFWAEEVVLPYEKFKAAGYDIAAATPGGVSPTVDELSLRPEYAGGEENAIRMRAALAEAAELAKPMPIEDVDLTEYDAVFYPGGFGPMEDLSSDTASAKLLAGTLKSGKILALVCHGPAALLATVDTRGASPFHGYRLTGFSNAEEALGGVSDQAKWLLQDRLEQELAADYVEGASYQPHTVTDRNLYTGQNPASAAPLADEVLKALA